MKRVITAGGLLGAVAGLTLLGASGALAATPKPAISANFPGGTTDIVFDGFCDGMQITNPGSAGAPGVQAVRTGSCTSPTPLFGATSGGGLGLADATYTIYTVIKPDHTWVYYQDCGFGSECVLVSGTWSYGVAAAPEGRLPSTAGGMFGMTRVGSPGAGRLPGPKDVSGFNISFDGFCDGESLNIPGAAGPNGADGAETGCATNALIGAYSAGGGSAAMWSYTEGVMWVINSDQTWIIYNDCGDGTECFVNSGTWSIGAPAAPQKNRTLLPSSLRH